MAGFTPAAADRLAYLILLVEGRLGLILRLIEDAQVNQGAALTVQTITDFRTYVAAPGADVPRAVRDLSALSTQLAIANRAAEAAMVNQAIAAINP
jgi:hypothetical protein